ncbi:hypothetical protein MBLNU230_g0422t1 [Neophaeotheca triangularis]
MPSAAERPPSTTSSASSGRRLLTRFTRPFASRTRNVTEFAVEIEEPLKQHCPGDLVKGSVRLRVTKPTRVQHIVVCLHGFVQVYRNPGSPGDGYKGARDYLGTGRGKKSGEYFGNGFASLFEDEVVLCGDGRLGEGLYQFKFELEFPDRDLPSSIEFERGTICYMVTATVTRPTTMSPTMRTDCKVYFVERIDIGPLVPPNPRTITLEPISRRSKAKHQAKRLVEPTERRDRRTESSSEGSVPGDSGTSSGPNTDAQSQQLRSFSASQASIASVDSDSGRTGSVSQSPNSSENPNVSRVSLGGRIITTKISSLSSGCLRGDNIHVKIDISHTKHVKSLYGAIVTLYRQARTDLHPAIPLGPTEKGTAARYEDYYPKSLTGLGGLSLSGAGSSHVFRKDLSQTMLPLLVDPTTLTTEINAKVRVPEEAFPTIATVPGGMISFKYYVEVVLDIQGKLAGQDRQLSNIGAIATSPIHAVSSDRPEGERSAFSTFGPQVADTSHIRRDKSVIACTFEMVVGTNDSYRHKNRGKQKMEYLSPPEDQILTPINGNITGDERPQTTSEGALDQGHSWGQCSNGHNPLPNGPGEADHHEEDNTPQPPRNNSYDRPPPEEPIPLPPTLRSSQMTEKERMRQHELGLLPSAPPIDSWEAHTSSGANAPTAPYLPEENHSHHPYHSHDLNDENIPGTAAPAYNTANFTPSTAQGLNSLYGADQLPLPPTPQYEEAGPSSASAGAGFASAAATVNGGPPVGDDKQELQRRRLEMETSAPPADDGGQSERDAGQRHEDEWDREPEGFQREYWSGEGEGYWHGEGYGYDQGYDYDQYHDDYGYDHHQGYGGYRQHRDHEEAVADAAPSVPRFEDLTPAAADDNHLGPSAPRLEDLEPPSASVLGGDEIAATPGGAATGGAESSRDAQAGVAGAAVGEDGRGRERERERESESEDQAGAREGEGAPQLPKYER